jgi:Ca2+-binding EF-hand superfamily protein
MVHNEVLQSREELHRLLLEQLQAVDVTSSGVLPLHTVKAVLRELSFQALGLNTIQVVLLISQAPSNEAGDIDYIKFVPQAASMISAMYDAEAVRQRLEVG